MCEIVRRYVSIVHMGRCHACIRTFCVQDQHMYPNNMTYNRSFIWTDLDLFWMTVKAQSDGSHNKKLGYEARQYFLTKFVAWVPVLHNLCSEVLLLFSFKHLCNVSQLCILLFNFRSESWRCTYAQTPSWGFKNVVSKSHYFLWDLT